MATYVISDIHGEYDKFIQMLNLIELSETDQLYVLGDMIDRGPKSIDTIKYIKNAKNIEAIIGNHEDMLLDAFTNYGLTGSIASRMLQGTDTNKTYKALRKLWYKDHAEPIALLNYLKKLPLYKEIEVSGKKYLLVHAGIKDGDLQKNEKDDFLWIRDEFLYNSEPFPFIVIFGHTPTQSFMQGTPRIYKSPNKIGIDCGVYFKDGKMACLRLDDFEEFYV